MKATELRLNNLFQDDLGNLLKVVKLDGENVTFYVIDRSKFPLEVGWKNKPIKLNDKWLVKFGFYYDSYIDRWRLNGFIIYWDSENERWFVNISDSLIVVLDYVHTLQNIFAFTGEELTIK